MEWMETVGERFQGYFVGDYDGSYHTPQADRARHDFDRLTDNRLLWTQVHGDFKDAAKRALFVPYPHWPELYQCCKDAVREHTALETQYVGGPTCAKIMRDAMTILRARHSLNVPRWWLPMMDQLRGKNHEMERAKKAPQHAAGR
jgi:hypothetical protein